MAAVDTLAAAQTYAASLDSSFPPLTTYASLTGAVDALKSAADAALQGEPYPAGETLSVPRRSGGAPRPVTILMPAVSVAYSALVGSLGEVLPVREASSYLDFLALSATAKTAYLVESDIASCYEYIDHNLLRHELIRVDPSCLTESIALHRLLGNVYPRGLGIPQMNSNSDRLADFYIASIVRRVQLRGYDTYTFADDFRIPVDNWAMANECVEDLSEAAREMGLVLSQNKTVIWRLENLAAREATFQEYWREHLAPQGESGDAHFFRNPYAAESPPGTTPNVDGAMGVIERWHAQKGRVEYQTSEARLEDRFITQALMIAASAEQAIANEVLRDYVFYQPHHLSVVPHIMTERSNVSENSDLLDSLIESGRQSAWFKLWLLHLLTQTPEVTEGQRSWLSAQLRDRHELVRAEAAWAKGTHGYLQQQDLEDAYRAAGPLTSHTLAACTVFLAANKTLKAIAADGPLNKAARHWAEDE